MANEVIASVLLGYQDAYGNDCLRPAELLATSSGAKFVRSRQSIGVTEEAVQLAEVTGPKWALFVNRDATNYVELKTGTGGVIVARLLPGEFAVIPLGSGMQAPYAIAHTAPVVIEYLIISA